MGLFFNRNKQKQFSEDEIRRMSPAEISDNVFKYGATEPFLNEVRYRLKNGYCKPTDFNEYYRDFAFDKETVISACYAGCDVSYRALPENLKEDYDVALAAMHARGTGYNELLPQFKGDRKIALAAINRDPEQLRDMPIGLRKDKLVVSEAISKNPSTFAYAANELKENKGFVMEAMSKVNPVVLTYAADDIKNSKDCAIFAVSRLGERGLACIGDNFKEDLNMHLLAKFSEVATDGGDIREAFLHMCDLYDMRGDLEYGAMTDLIKYNAQLRTKSVLENKNEGLNEIPRFMVLNIAKEFAGDNLNILADARQNQIENPNYVNERREVYIQEKQQQRDYKH